MMKNDDKKNTPAACEFITDSAQSARWFQSLGGPDKIAFDLEADGLFSYEDKICLVQVCCGQGRCAILDPLADPGVLDPLVAMITDESVLKIVHGGDYDVRLLKKDLGVACVNLFDTMIAGQLLGYERLGLAALVEDEYGDTLDKKYQRADWSKRPLTEEMLSYAAKDVIYLHGLHAKISGQLEDQARTAWAAEEFKLLEAAQPPAQKGPWCLDVKGSNKLTPRQLAVLQALLELRDSLAKKWDRPPFKVLSNQVLIEWAQAGPLTRSKVTSTRGAGKGILERLAKNIVDLSKEALALPEDKLPQRPPARDRVIWTPEQKELLKALKATRAAVCEKLSIDPGLLVNTATLERLALNGTEGDGELVRQSLKGWQFEAIGVEFKETLEGSQQDQAKEEKT